MIINLQIALYFFDLLSAAFGCFRLLFGYEKLRTNKILKETGS